MLYNIQANKGNFKYKIKEEIMENATQNIIILINSMIHIVKRNELPYEDLKLIENKLNNLKCIINTKM